MKDDKKLIAKELNKFRNMGYTALKRLIDSEPVTGEITGAYGKWYFYEIQVFWDGKPNGNIRVIGSVDDGGWRSLNHVSDSFIIDCNNRFIGEDD